jgi:hypothetical protein
MPIKIVKRNPGVEPQPVEPQPVEPPVEPPVKQVALIDSHCQFLTRIPAAGLNHKDNVMIASLLGLGSKEAQQALWHEGRIVQEWIKIVPWFLHPEVGEALLPDDAVWEIHRGEVDGGFGGWATISIPSSGQGPWTASAPSSWAAFAICLLQAFKDDAYAPRLAKS